MKVFNASREDQLNQVTPTNPLLKSPPKMTRPSSLISRSASIIMGSPIRRAGASSSTSAKIMTSKHQSQRDDLQGERGTQNKAELPTPKTNLTPTSSETLDGRCLFPEGPPQGDNQTHDAPIRHSTDQKNEREETDTASDHETILLEWLM